MIWLVVAPEESVLLSSEVYAKPASDGSASSVEAFADQLARRIDASR